MCANVAYVTKQHVTVEVKGGLIMMGEREAENTRVISFEVLQDELNVNRVVRAMGREGSSRQKLFQILTHSKYSINSIAIHFCFVMTQKTKTSSDNFSVE